VHARCCEKLCISRKYSNTHRREKNLNFLNAAQYQEKVYVAIEWREHRIQNY